MTATNKPKYIMPRESHEMCRTKWRKVEIKLMRCINQDLMEMINKSLPFIYSFTQVFFLAPGMYQEQRLTKGDTP